MGCHHGTGHAQHCHLVVTCPVTVVTVKTIVIAGYLYYRITKNQFQGFGINTRGEIDTDDIL